MKEIQEDERKEQSKRKSNEASSPKLPITSENQSDENIEQEEMGGNEKIFQRKPQFRLIENSKRRFS